MKSIKFKTDIKCNGCLAKVTPELNKTVGENSWEVDINNPDKILTVVNENVSESDILDAINKAGFKGEKLG